MKRCILSFSSISVFSLLDFPVGIGCPDIHRMSDGPQKTSLKRKTQSAVLPTLAPICAEENEAGPALSNAEKRPLRRLTAPAHSSRWDQPRSAQSPRANSPVRKSEKEEEQHLITEAGALRVHSNIRLDPVVFSSPEKCRPPLTSLTCPCPVLLRNAMLGEGDKKMCKCSNHQMPSLTDMECDAFVQGQALHSQQVLVVCVTSSAGPQSQFRMGVLEELYEKMNRNRSMPCAQCRQDTFRLVKYDVSTAGTHASRRTPLLLQRHNVAPGMFLMYMSGKLLFADYIFNGYSCSVKDLQKQISKTRGDYGKGHCLPVDFRLSPQRQTPETVDSLAPPGPTAKARNGEQRESCQSRATLQSEESKLQPSGRAQSVQEYVTFSTSKRSHLLSGQKSLPVPFPSLNTERGSQTSGPTRLLTGSTGPRP
ncbi:uncharacterized protein C3orf20-like [Amia ocellicauda]|uniref:uncharacterized protein C3orf20-like n=1 Tax=Amia ocellicauda TaxID=2972642 RepID=UPI0034642627